MDKLEIGFELEKEDPRLRVKDKKLPYYPSELLKLALDDIAVVKKNKIYHINTSVWHTANVNTCSVCLAGAVLANTLKASSLVSLTHNSLRHRYIGGENGRDNYSKMLIIELLRRLNLSHVYIKYKELTLEDIEVIEEVKDVIYKKVLLLKDFIWKDVCKFKDFKVSHDFYWSIVKDIVYLDKQILG